jgi:hypothetical protein
MRAEVEDRFPLTAGQSGVGTVDRFHDLPACREDVIGVGRIHLEGIDELRVGDRRRHRAPGRSAVGGDANVRAGRRLVGDVAVVGIDFGERAVAAVDGILLAVRRDLQVAVVLQTGVGRAVLRHRHVVGQQRVEAGLIAVAPSAVVQLLAWHDVLLVEAAVVANRQRDTTTKAIGNPDAGMLIGMRRL